MKYLVACALLLAPLPAFAQTDQVSFLSKALAVLQQQRNAAMDEAVNAKAEAAMLREALVAAQEKIKNLDTKKEPQQ